MKSEARHGKIGRRGTVVIPAPLRKRYGLEEGELVIMEARAEGVMIRRGVALPIEIYTPERKAEFLMGNSGNAKEYAQARKEVRKMGLDPDKIPHYKPTRLR